ncbi:Ig-like domain-containing protein [Planococcus sp. N028]|uniref:Ig-like domain-containing protein n=1 Tax=Planococcus shixiaomingii TaxID=3058393 RepID=A0ABT8N1C4_9BACL|nr:Ig-like domain-containing protein [Planococcus sp. N028]MDN7241693.1 Ig-like domain-containing protein [Planococcus sp. N028]
MKKPFLLLIGVMLFMPIFFLAVPTEPEAAAADKTFMDVIKIDREDYPITELKVFEDKIITSYHGTSSGEPDLVSSYSKTGKLLWEKEILGKYAIGEDVFVIGDNQWTFPIYSSDTGKEIKRVSFPSNFTYRGSKIYMNENYILFFGSVKFGGKMLVYDTDGNYVTYHNHSGVTGAALYKDTLLFQDGRGIYAMKISTQEKLWHVPADTYWNNDEDLIPKDNKIFVRGVEGEINVNVRPPSTSLFVIDLKTGRPLYKKDFGKYWYTDILKKDFGFLAAHAVDDTYDFYNFDGTLNKTLSMESAAIKQLKEKHKVTDEYHVYSFDFITAKDGFYAYRRYSGVDEEYAFSTIKIFDKSWRLKFEKVINQNVYNIATTYSDKLFVTSGLGLGYLGDVKYYGEEDELNVYNSKGLLLETIKTERIPQLVSDGHNLFGYGSKTLYIFNESKDTTPPSVPTINQLKDSSNSVTGKAQIRSKIFVYAGSKKLGETIAKNDTYSMKIAKQKGGTQLTVYAEDRSGNRSASAKTTVLDTSVRVASVDFDRLKVSWSQVPGASGYDIYRAYFTRNYNKFATVPNGNTLTYTDSDVWLGDIYYYKVRSYRIENDKKVYGPYSGEGSGIPTLKAVTSVKAAASGYSKNKISWPKVNGASDYYVYRATTKTGTYKNVQTVYCMFSCSYEDTGLTAGNTYYYKVRAFKFHYDKNLYGPYSSIVSATPALAKPSKISVSKVSSTSVKASWDKVTEASGYELYQATSKTGTYTKVKTQSSPTAVNYTNIGLSKGKTYYYKVRAYRIVSGKKIYSSYTTIVSSKL